MGPYQRPEPVTQGASALPKLVHTQDALACQNGGRPAPRPFEAGSPAGADCFRAFPKARGTQERRGRERPRPEPGSCVDGTEGEGRPDVSGAAISCFSAVFLSFGWWLLLCFAFQSSEGQAEWTAVPALGAPPPAASHPPAPRCPSPPLPASVTGRRRRGPQSGPNAGHQVCGGGRRVSARPCWALRSGSLARRHPGRAALGSPQARKASSCRRAHARPSGGRGPPTLPGLVPASGWGRAWASGPEGKVNSTLLPSSRAGHRPSPCSGWHVDEAGLKNFS